jgi:uncharacterized membrane protein YqgA involved in biofilm formation
LAVIGTFTNLTAILIGSAVGWFSKRDLTATQQSWLKVGLGAYSVYLGLSLIWTSLTGSAGHQLKQLGLLLLALILGKATGRFLGIQTRSNRLGQFAKDKFNPDPCPGPLSDSFVTCVVLFCAGPIGVVGALLEGLLADSRTLLVKALMDGLAAISFSRIFGWGIVLSLIPLLALQGTVTMLAGALEPFLQRHQLIHPLAAACGFLVFCIALVILELKRIELADYLPSLVYAPLLGAWAWN